MWSEAQRAVFRALRESQRKYTYFLLAAADPVVIPGSTAEGGRAADGGGGAEPGGATPGQPQRR